MSYTTSLRYGNIAYEQLQDIELVVISVKELQHLLSTHYRCRNTTIQHQILEFEATHYHHDIVEPHLKSRFCAIMKGVVWERDQVLAREGVDFLRDRAKFIAQVTEVFVNLSPMESGGVCIAPARYSVLVPRPNSHSRHADLTFIDYEQYEDISVAVKVTKRVDHILREVFQQPGGSLVEKVNYFPYDADNVKRKLTQIIMIRDKMVTERYFNNFQNRKDYVALSQSIFGNLIEIVDSGRVQQDPGFGGRVQQDPGFSDNLDVDMGSYTTEDNNVTVSNTTVSTYHIPAVIPPTNRLLSPRPTRHIALSPSLQREVLERAAQERATLERGTWERSTTKSFGTSGNYELLRDDSTIPNDAEAFALHEYSKTFGTVQRYDPRSPTQVVRNVPQQPPPLPSPPPPLHRGVSGRTRYRYRQERKRRDSKKLNKICQHCCITFSIFVFIAVIAIICWKYLM